MIAQRPEMAQPPIASERAVTQDSSFYASLVRSSDVAIVGKDLEGIVLTWNPAAELLFGWNAEEMVGQSIRRLIPPGREAEEDLILSRIRSGERIAQFFTRRLHKSGMLLDILVTVSPVRDSDGRIVGASKIARDAGPLIEQQRRLRESEERFRMLADNMSQLAWIAKSDGHICWYNKRWYDYTGTSFEQMEGWGWRAVHAPEHVDRVEAHFRESLADGSTFEELFPLRGADGTFRWFLTRAMPIRDEEGQITFWFGTNTDITEQREQAEQIRRLLMEVNHRSKNLLSTVQALARRTAPDEAGFIARFEERVHSLALNQDILVRREWRDVPLDELVSLQLAFLKGAPGTIAVAGGHCALVPRAAEAIGMALHELATNSLRYGALSVEGGQVAIGWGCPPEHVGLALWWRESGGPPVEEPGRKGFGATLICDVPRHNLSARVALEYRPEGVCWSLECDARVLAETTPAVPH